MKKPHYIIPFYHIFISDILYWDAVGGLTSQAWDREVDNPIEITRAINNAKNNNNRQFTIILIVTARQQPIFEKVLADLQFADIDTLYWIKSEVNPGHPIGPHQRIVPAVEIVITARSTTISSKEYRPANFERIGNEIMAKFNYFMGPEERNKARASGQMICPYQRPAWLSSYLAKPYCFPGARAVVFGAGLGGDVKGLLDIDCNVLAIELNQNLFGILVNEMMNYEPASPNLTPMTMYEIAMKMSGVDETMEIVQPRMKGPSEEKKIDVLQPPPIEGQGNSGLLPPPPLAPDGSVGQPKVNYII